MQKKLNKQQWLIVKWTKYLIGAKGNSMPIRDAIWDHEMEANNHDTMKTEAACEWMLKADDDKIKDYCEKNLKK